MHTLVDLLHVHEADGGPVCCHAQHDAEFGFRWQMLATVGLNPAAVTMSVANSRPCDLRDDSWTTSNL